MIIQCASLATWTFEERSWNRNLASDCALLTSHNPYKCILSPKKYDCEFVQILSHASHKCLCVEIHSHFQKHSPASTHITQPINMYVLNKYICKLDELLSRVHTNHSIASVRKLLPNKCILVSGKIHFWIVVEVLKYCVSCLRRFPAC